MGCDQFAAPFINSAFASERVGFRASTREQSSHGPGFPLLLYQLYISHRKRLLRVSKFKVLRWILCLKRYNTSSKKKKKKHSWEPNNTLNQQQWRKLFQNTSSRIERFYKCFTEGLWIPLQSGIVIVFQCAQVVMSRQTTLNVKFPPQAIATSTSS